MPPEATVTAGGETLTAALGPQVPALRLLVRPFSKLPAPTSLVAYDQFPDATSIRTVWKELEGKVRPFVDGLGEAGINKPFDYKLLSGAPDTAPFWQMLVHVVNHGAYHRGQVTTLLRQLGAHPPKPTDMIAFFRTRR